MFLQVSDYKVKVMIAEPKGKRGRRDPLFSDAFAHAIQQPGLEYGATQLGPYSTMGKPFLPILYTAQFDCTLVCRP